MRQLPALDGLRGIAIILVILYHVRIAPTSNWGDLLVDFMRGSGWLGVDLFFVLSGFLIVGRLLDTVDQPGYLRNFFARRALRIWPLCYLVIVFALVCAPWFAELQAQRPWETLMAALFLQNVEIVWARVATPVTGGMWSLAVEEHVYLVLPFLVLIARRHLHWVFASAIVVALALRVATVWFAGDAAYLVTYFLTPMRIDSFAVGGLIALLMRNPSRFTISVRWILLAFVVSGTTLLSLAVVLFGFDNTQAPMMTWGFSLGALFFGSAVALAIRSRIAAHPLCFGPLRKFGKYSYSMYLVHGPLWLVVHTHFNPPVILGSRLPAQLFAWALMLALCFGAGWLSWHLVERRILDLKRYFQPSAVRRRPLPEAAWWMGPSEADTATGRWERAQRTPAYLRTQNAP